MATILIVDDHPTNRDFLASLLGYAGHRLLEAADGAEALDAARAARPDLILADIVMPTIDGYEFARRLRADPAIARIPVIFMTATYLERDSLAFARAVGVEHVIAKPATPEIVLSTVAAVLGAEAPALSAVPPPETFDRQHIRLLTDKLAAKVDELTATNERLAALVELSRRLAAERDPAVLLQLCCDAAREIVGARYAAIDLRHESESLQCHRYSSGFAIEALAPGGDLWDDRLVRMLLERERPLRVDDMRAEPWSEALPHEHPPVGSFLGTSIVSASRRYGVLFLGEKLGAAEFSVEDEQVIVTLASQVAVAYENALRYDDLQRHAGALEQEIAERRRAEKQRQQVVQRLRTMHQIDQAILAAHSPQAIIQAALRHVRELVPCQRASVSVFDYDAGVAETWGVDSDISDHPPIVARFELREIPDLAALKRGQPQIARDLRRIARPTPTLQALLNEGTRTLLAVPIGLPDDLFGTLNLAAEQPGYFVDEYIAIAREVADMLAVAIQSARLFEQVHSGRRRLQVLSSQLVRAQEDERRRIARELHDEVGQSLTAAQLSLQALLGLADLSELPPRLEDSFSLIDRVLQQVRALSLDLRPSLLDDLGLAPALRWLGKRQAERAGYEVQIDTTAAQERYAPDIETTCYRVAQEALNNIARHAGARYVTIVLARQRNTLRLHIHDDGAGFDVEAARERAAQGSSLGLLSMHERVELAGGKMAIHSAPGRGTRMDIVLPLGKTVVGQAIERRRASR